MLYSNDVLVVYTVDIVTGCFAAMYSQTLLYYMEFLCHSTVPIGNKE